MHFTIRVFFASLALFVVVIGAGQACSQFDVGSESGSSTGGALAYQPVCSTPSGVSGSPKSIEEAVALINALPKPVSVPCFLDSLDRPLKVSLSNNPNSAQPASGARSPRVFIFSEPLIISVVPEGFGGNVVEFSVLTAPDMSVKGELPFPVSADVPPEAPYTEILLGSGTICATCHRNETRAFNIPFANAFVSQALRPRPDTVVSVESLRQQAVICDAVAEPQRCAVLRSLFGGGGAKAHDFPSSMPTAF